jgi:hypothetical protein
MRISFAALGNSMPPRVTAKRYDEIKRFFLSGRLMIDRGEKS